MKRVNYNINRKAKDMRWPGEFWDGPFSLATARFMMRHSYSHDDFRIVKVTTEAVDSPSTRARRGR